MFSARKQHPRFGSDIVSPASKDLRRIAHACAKQRIEAWFDREECSRHTLLRRGNGISPCVIKLSVRSSRRARGAPKTPGSIRVGLRVIIAVACARLLWLHRCDLYCFPNETRPAIPDAGLRFNSQLHGLARNSLQCPGVCRERSPMSSESPDRIAVYRFEVWDQTIGDNVWAPRMATLETIRRVGGAADLGSETWVDRAALDSQGYFPAHGP